MSVLRCDVSSAGLVLQGSGSLRARLRAALATCPAEAPVVVLLHGYRFSHHVAAHSPHTHIFALEQNHHCWKATSWPQALGFDTACAQEGLCIAVGWHARGSIWAAWREAERAGSALADLIAILAALGRRVDLVGHSLGARVALQAVARSPRAAIRRVILLNAAEFCQTARNAAESVAGRSAEIFNIFSRENAVFETLLERLVAAPKAGDKTVGAGLSLPNWLDIQIDNTATQQALARFGAQIAPGTHLWCHWSPYLRPGLMAFYARLLREPKDLTFAALRARMPTRLEPRWSRLHLIRQAQRLWRGAKPDAAAGRAVAR